MNRNELLEQYLEKVLLVQVAERDRGREELRRSAVHYLNTADPQQRLSEPIVTIFSMNISAKTSFDFPAAGNVFLVMEKYVINLLDCPWKREFRKITMYSGFYKTRIEPSLKDAWKLLLMIGYEKVGLCLELKVLPDASRLQNVALEFHLASLECSIYNDIFQKVSLLGFTLKNVHKCRRSIPGNSDVICKALSKLSLSEKRDEVSDSRAFYKTQSDLSRLPKQEQFEKHSGYEANVGSGVQIGGTQSGSSQQQMGSLSKVVQLPEPEKGGDACETRSESIEAMLQDITPEMISDVNIRRQILTKLIKPQPAKPQDELVHASLPPPPVQRESDMRPHTEPLLIPKQPKPASASDIQPYSEPLVKPKQQKPFLPSAVEKQPFIEPNIRKNKKTESKVRPNIQPYAEPLPVPKEKFTGDSDQRPWTEPLLIPKQEKVPSKLNSKSTEAIFPTWQCAYCYYTNNAAVAVEKCATCRRSRKEV